jgi:hypothetical protein
MKPSKKLAEFIVKKEFQKWADQNGQLIEDIQNLFNEMMMFEIKYGMKILYQVEKPKQPDGRGYGNNKK